MFEKQNSVVVCAGVSDAQLLNEHIGVRPLQRRDYGINVTHLCSPCNLTSAFTRRREGAKRRSRRSGATRGYVSWTRFALSLCIR